MTDLRYEQRIAAIRLGAEEGEDPEYGCAAFVEDCEGRRFEMMSSDLRFHLIRDVKVYTLIICSRSVVAGPSK